ncbi:hypothetical protein MCOR03_003346 [Pyricularia oryzae]|uniref:Phenylalanine ammonia-lyase n=1 Tax=Pyricularia grisea TaxID=148305 RepID=A0ABQ8NH88_PYRGI|nr:hypothetical protein MCOR33_006466 [Pyricularia grisea]KAI6385814.1 hypothetical protein MCOR32_001246 [Pyricularia oryzae]KAI6503291.1 hypothetical protein MCOR11_000892 [Pyricularia oryzae]KAI6562521.1 hypothetical protein MCOR03_003346 [Pyricularia oryzae]
MNHTEIALKEWRHLEAVVNERNRDHPSIVLTGYNLNLLRYNVPIGLNASAPALMQFSLNVLGNKLSSGEIIYGVNTGFGGSADVRTREFVKLQRALIREFHYGVLPPGDRDHHPPPLETPLARYQYDDVGNDSSHLPWSWARAAILIRINSLISGCSSVRPVIVERMRDLLTYDIVPMIPMRGSISASGDLSPLSYVCGAIQGKPTIRVRSHNGACQYADEAFADLGLEPIAIQAKEGLAMINGTAVSAAVAALALHDTHILAVAAQILTAMTVEALNGTTESFHSFFSEVRPHPGQIEWLGPILEDLVLAHQQISTECNSVTDNPLSTSGEIINGGNFQAKAVTSAMEKARQGVQGIGRMAFSQCTELINPVTNRGLPPNLVAEDPSISLIFKGADLHIASLAAELGLLAAPVNHVQTAEMGNQSLNSLALISARYTHTANEVLAQLLAVHLVTVCQALDLRAMHHLFMEDFRHHFYRLVAQHYPTAIQPKEPLASNGTSKAWGLANQLWAQLQVAFDSTTSLDAEDRFDAIAKLLRPVLLDHATLNKDPDFVTVLESFTTTLALSLDEAWCAHRDAYLIHGNAASLLGMASRRAYTFLRKSLRVPLMATWNLSTPRTEELEAGTGVHGSQAPTVGSFVSAVYRSLRDGTFAKLAMDILESV